MYKRRKTNKKIVDVNVVKLYKNSRCKRRKTNKKNSNCKRRKIM